jgi:hypothetical protein
MIGSSTNFTETRGRGLRGLGWNCGHRITTAEDYRNRNWEDYDYNYWGYRGVFSGFCGVLGIANYLKVN